MIGFVYMEMVWALVWQKRIVILVAPLGIPTKLFDTIVLIVLHTLSLYEVLSLVNSFTKTRREPMIT